MLTIHAGFNPKNLLTAQVSLPSLKYRDDAQVRAFYSDLLRGLESIPQARSAGASASFGTADGLYIEGRPDPRPGEPWPFVRSTSAHYFEAMGIPILQGRSISEQDGPDSQRVTVVSETIARHYWPDSDPIGRRIRLGAHAPWLTVVGVAGDTKDWFTNRVIPRVYVPFPQSPGSSIALYVRTDSNPMLAAGALKAKVREVDKNQPVYDVKSMEEQLIEETSGVRASASMMSMFATIALVLAVTGIYAVISYSVVQRTHEVGVRIALGASSADVVKLTMRRAVFLAGIGLAVGLPAAFALTRLMSSVLFDVVALDWTVFASFTVVLASSAILAGYIPARRATKVDPVEALHHE
jgi:putative ABC transport system permease protein